MKDTTIKQVFGELWHVIRIRKEYYDMIYEQDKSKSVSAFKLVYNEIDTTINWLIDRFEKEE